MRTYSRDLRERIVAARKQGYRAQELSKLFGVSKRSVERYWKKYLSTGSIEPKQRGGYRRSRLEGFDQRLRGWIKEKKDLTLAELQERIAQNLGINLGRTALWYRLERLGLSYKKNATRRRARPGGAPGRPPKLASEAKKLGGSKARFPR